MLVRSSLSRSSSPLRVDFRPLDFLFFFFGSSKSSKIASSVRSAAPFSSGRLPVDFPKTRSQMLPLRLSFASGLASLLASVVDTEDAVDAATSKPFLFRSDFSPEGFLPLSASLLIGALDAMERTSSVGDSYTSRRSESRELLTISDASKKSSRDSEPCRPSLRSLDLVFFVLSSSSSKFSEGTLSEG